jgi:hypothetical protein
MLQQLTGRKPKTAVLENECAAGIYRSGRGADDGGGGNTLPLALNLCICDTPKKIKTELRFRRMLDPWITFRHTLPACARK